MEELAPADEPVPDADAIAEAEQAATKCAAASKSLGAVNAAAMEEYQEAQQRHDFLSAQRQDLIDSIRDTEKAIQEIDQVSRQKFAEAFEAINANFRVGFQTLFGGGTGEMRLTDQENLADRGIDIVCSPPGKRLQNVLLLSGGEKALAAVALLMAIFKYQPSPFCVMDEVDAPLDEANIGRLTKLVQEMSAQHAVRGDHALQADHGSGAGAVRRDDAGARRQPPGEREVQRGGSGGVKGRKRKSLNPSRDGEGALSDKREARLSHSYFANAALSLGHLYTSTSTSIPKETRCRIIGLFFYQAPNR